MADKFFIECGDGYLGEFWTHDELEAQHRVKVLDDTCSCGGPHRVLMNEFEDDA